MKKYKRYKRYMKRNLDTKSGRVVLAVFFLLLVSLSVGGGLYVFQGDKWFGTGQAQVLPISYGTDYSTYIFTLNEKNLSMKAGETHKLNIEAKENKAFDHIEWTSSNNKIVHVSPVGNLTALKKGKVKITATAGYYSSSCTVNVKENKENNTKTFSTAYTANQKKLEENKKSNSSKNLYYIEVNRTKNCVTVYTYNKKGVYNVPVRAMICSCGANGGTPTGKFYVAYKSRWQSLFGNVYGQYTTQFNGDILFHSVPYKNMNDPTSVKVQDYNNLGKSVSMGCVRLAIADTKWIYDNCKAGTVVKVFDSEKEGPLGTPPSMKIKTSSQLSWDPTDHNPDNPYYKKSPTLKGIVNTSVKIGDKINLKSGISAKDTCGNTITNRIKIKGKVNTKKAGEYLVRYSVKDYMNRTAEQYRIITVK